MKKMSLSELQALNTEVAMYAKSLEIEDTMPKNVPHATVKATIFRNAYVGDIEVHRDIEVTLDQYGIHGTCVLGGEEVTLTRLNASLDYSFDAPDTVCPISAKKNYTYFDDWKKKQ